MVAQKPRRSRAATSHHRNPCRHHCPLIQKGVQAAGPVQRRMGLAGGVAGLTQAFGLATTGCEASATPVVEVRVEVDPGRAGQRAAWGETIDER